MNIARPNILWIVTTQWRARACGFAGDPNARTPCLDALAAESINFAQATTPHPFGPFARAAMLTGTPSPENGVRDYFDPLPAGARTIAHALRGRGYATAFFGKWHLWKRDPSAPLVGEAHAKIVVPLEARGGFEFWEGFESGFLLNDPWLHGTRLAQPERFEGYQSDVVCARAAEWLGEKSREAESPSPNKNRPWFCVVSLEPPHPPYDAPVPRPGAGPAAGTAARDGREILLPANVPPGGKVEAQARRELAGYYAHIEATDRAVGQLFARGPKANTLVVFTSVHGDMHGAHGLFRKGWPYEESVRVPLLVRAPLTTKPKGENPTSRGLKRDDAVSLADLPRMTLDYADGGELGATRWDFARISMPSVVPLPYQCDREWRGVRTKTRKLVLAVDSTGSPPAGEPWLFFDLENDPQERRNLAGDTAQARAMADWRAIIG